LTSLLKGRLLRFNDNVGNDEVFFEPRITFEWKTERSMFRSDDDISFYPGSGLMTMYPSTKTRDGKC